VSARVWIGGMVLAVGVLSAIPVRAQSELPPLERDTLFVQPGERVVCLNRSFILASTFSLRENGRLLDPKGDYLLDADSGCFTLVVADTLVGARVLVASFRALPMTLQGIYRIREDPHLREVGTAAPGDTAARPPTPFNPSEETQGLDISGSKTFGVTIGNRQDLKLQQSLDLRLSGQVTHDVSLLAILSDQDLPFQPQGNTAELSELDRVLVQVRSPRASASLGDVSLGVTGYSFLDLSRELEGLTGEATLGRARTRAAAASAKGEFTSRQFFGTDGKQGPYLLTDRADSTDIVVVAGTEKVWLDGTLLSRGEEADYTIDYALGEISFTSRHTITANSEITVDYQVASSRYRRRVTFAETQAAMGRAGTLRAAYFGEGDDANNPFGGELTPAERAQLAALGDSARVSGGTRYVGPGNGGDYQLVVDPESGHDIYVYVEGAGDYQVSFVDVGNGKGEYEVDPESPKGKTVYRYVGPGQGSFVPRRDLPAPERKRLTDLRWDLRGSGGALTVEGAVSNTDANTLSPLGDGNNQGGALIAEGRLKSVEAGAFSFSPGFKVRRVGGNFRSPGRIRPAFYSREWNLTGAEEFQDESLGEASLTTRWGERLRWEATAGRLAAADTFRAVRQSQSVSWNDAWVAAGGGWTTTRDRVNGASGNLARTTGEILLRRWAVQPRVSGLNESRRRALGGGERHREWDAALLFPSAFWPVDAEIGAGRRLDDSLAVDGAWRGALDTRSLHGSVNGRAGSLTFLLRYEARRVESPGSGTERRDLGRVDLRQQAVEGAWTAVLTADIGTEGIRRRTKEIVPAASDSAGYFDRFGNYVGPGGGYDVIYGPRGDEVLSGTVNLTSRFRWSPPGGKVRAPAWLGRVAWEGFVNLNESSTLPLTTPRYFLDPGSYLSKATTLSGRLTERQTLDLFPLHRGAGLRLAQETDRSLTQSPESTSGAQKLVETSVEDTYTATFRWNPAPGWDTETEGSLGDRREGVDLGAGGSFEQSTRLRTATLRGGRRVAVAGGNGRLSSEVSYSVEKGSGREGKAWVWRPRLQWSLPRVGRLDARYTRIDFIRREGFTGFRGPGAPALTEGWRLDVIGEARVKEGVTVTLAVAVDHPTGLSEVREGRMEVRGSF
jgi:hypothetical protein